MVPDRPTRHPQPNGSSLGHCATIGTVGDSFTQLRRSKYSRRKYEQGAVELAQKAGAKNLNTRIIAIYNDTLKARALEQGFEGTSIPTDVAKSLEVPPR
jgi:hypothetical protein